MPHDEKMQEFMAKMAGDLGAAMGVALVLIGERLGLYRAMGAGVTSGELAERTGTAERYVREWLAAQAAAGYVQYNHESERYSLSPEQAAAFVNEGSVFFMIGGFEIAASMIKDQPRLEEAFRDGSGVGWHEHDPMLFRGTERVFHPGYAVHLVKDWIPALDGIGAKLERGAKVADVGCGRGSATILMAKAFPNSTFIGFDYHQPSLDRAARAACDAGLTNARFTCALAHEYPGHDYDMVTFFDCLHDMGDPIGAVAYARSMLDANGTLAIVEPFAGDSVSDNMTPLGRMFYAVSAMICTPAALAQQGGFSIGTQAGEKRIREIATKAGFRKFRRAAQSRFNLVFEARP